MHTNISKRIPVWKQDPVLYVKEVLSAEPDEWQSNVLMDLASNNIRMISVKSGQGVGKTAVESWAICWFLTMYPNCKVIATAPTARQLKDVLWAEVAKWIEKSPLLKVLLKPRKTYIFFVGHEDRWFATARTATKPENLQGFHEDNMLFIVDEASGVSDPIMEAIRGTLSGANNKLILMSNPTRTSGAFYDSHTVDAKDFSRYTVNSEKVSRTNKENIASLKRKYGEESNVVRVRVYGEFPTQEDDVFIGLSAIENNIATDVCEITKKAINEKTGANLEKVQIGCDVARFGDDKTVISIRLNEVVKIHDLCNGQDTTQTAGKLSSLYKQLKYNWKYNGEIVIAIDDGGVGGGVVDALKAMKRAESNVYDNMLILPVNFGKPIKHRYYYDSTTYMMGVIKDCISKVDDNGIEKEPEIILPNNADLIGQLSCRKYSFVTNGKIKVESKKDMKARGISSPDVADSVLLACLPRKNKRERRKA